MGRDLALLGVGLRSNVEAAAQLMDRDLLGARRFGVVRDEFDKHQVFSCLFCVSCVVVLFCFVCLLWGVCCAAPLRKNPRPTHPTHPKKPHKKQQTHKKDRMHLDCVFSVLGSKSCLMLADIMGAASPTRRLVDEYVRDARTARYQLVREGVEFADFMRGEGYSILPISSKCQLQYACNVLNLGAGRIISVHAASARRIVKEPSFKGE